MNIGRVMIEIPVDGSPSQGAQYSLIKQFALIILRVLVQFQVYSLINPYWALWVFACSFMRLQGTGLAKSNILAIMGLCKIEGYIGVYRNIQGHTRICSACRLPVGATCWHVSWGGYRSTILQSDAYHLLVMPRYC